MFIFQLMHIQSNKKTFNTLFGLANKLITSYIKLNDPEAFDIDTYFVHLAKIYLCYFGNIEKCQKCLKCVVHLRYEMKINE